MSERDESLGLADVRNRFLDAERKLTSIAGAIEELDAASAQLTGSGTALREAAQRVGDLAATLASLSSAMREATDVVQKTDPATVVRLLQENEIRATELQSFAQSQTGRMEDIEARLGQMSDRIQEIGKETNAIEISVKSVRNELKSIEGHLQHLRSTARANLVLVVIGVLLAGGTLALVALRLS